MGLLGFLLSGMLCAAADWLWVARGRWADWRLSVVRGVLACSALLVAWTEVFSVFGALTPRNLAAAWGWTAAVLGMVVVAGCVVRYRDGLRFPVRMPKPRLAWIAFAAFLAVWLGVLFWIALVAAPNNFDSLTYRLPRVMHWASNASVAHYPTEVVRALDRSPFHEWIVLHVYLLTGNDRFFALVQWFMLVFGLVAVWELTKSLGGKSAACALAVILCVTAPMAVLQATSTQNNIVAAFAFVAFLLFGLRLSHELKHPWTEAGFCGLALGLAILTQTTSLVFAFGFCVWFGVMILRRHRSRGWILGGVVALATLPVLVGYGWRNYELFGHPFGLKGEPPLRYFPDEDRTKVAIPYTNDGMTPFIYASNLFRNAVMHLATPFQNPNDSVAMFVKGAYGWLGMPLDDPRSTLFETHFFLTADRHEDFAGNLPLCVIAFAALLVYPFRWRKVTRLAGPFAGCILAAILLFAYVLRWQPFHPRVELPLFFAWAVFAAVVLPVATHRWLAGALAGLSIAYAFPYWIDNYRRPLFGKNSILTTSRELQYFRDFPLWHPDYYRAVRELKKRNYRRVGLWTDGHDLHYPIWPMYRRLTKRDLGFFEVEVTNISGKLSNGEMPDAVLTTHVPVLKSIVVNGVRYDEVWHGDRTLAIYEPAKSER